MDAPPASALALIISLLFVATAADGRLLHQWVAEPGAGGGPVLRTTISFGSIQVPCAAFSPSTQDWYTPSSATLYTATGNTRPPFNETEDFISRICEDPQAAGSNIASAVQEGGVAAQAAVVAQLNADCPSTDTAGPESYSAAIDQVNPTGDPADLEEVSSWFTNLAAAADAVGIPACATVAVVDPTGNVVEQRTFHTSGMAAPAAEGGGSSSERVRTSVVFGQNSVTCDVYDPASDSWVVNDTAPVYGASGTTSTPPPSLVAALGNQVCSDPMAAGPLFRDAVQGGGEQAQLWTYALLKLGPDCPDPSALSTAYSYAIGGINTGTIDSVDPISEWFDNLVAAGDAVGAPLCASLAIINEATGEVEQRDFHTGGDEGA